MGLGVLASQPVSRLPVPLPDRVHDAGARAAGPVDRAHAAVDEGVRGLDEVGREGVQIGHAHSVAAPARRRWATITHVRPVSAGRPPAPAPGRDDHDRSRRARGPVGRVLGGELVEAPARAARRRRARRRVAVDPDPPQRASSRRRSGRRGARRGGSRAMSARRASRASRLGLTSSTAKHSSSPSSANVIGDEPGLPSGRTVASRATGAARPGGGAPAGRRSSAPQQCRAAVLGYVAPCIAVSVTRLEPPAGRRTVALAVAAVGIATLGAVGLALAVRVRSLAALRLRPPAADG